ncbi:alpha/beta hydrolase [Variovorax rhizosphaerae]|uniref:Alpha/beta fold hydrolase n=1 Tax=Variovorax rhizosphaerae TaxID=1836200 RepID=A0ABU8WMZ9_9BURK
MKRPLAALIMAILPAMASAESSRWVEQEVCVQDLHGTLALPGETALVPAVLILAGSGPADRNGNLPGMPNNSLRLLAHGLAEQGIASIRVDKRGIGASQAGVREDDLRFATYVDDAVAWLKFLRVQSRVERLVLLGHSEGALVATMAAQQAEVDALILVAGASEPAARLIAQQLAVAGLPAALQAQSRSIADSLERGTPVATAPPELAALYRPSVQSYLMAWFPLDPSVELSKVERPTLIVQGTTDLQINVDDALRLAAARPGSELLLIEGMNHILKEAPTGRSQNLQTYAVPDLPLAPLLVPAIARFVSILP